LPIINTAPPLSQQTVLITGAAQGLGRALALAFAAAGAHLVLVDFDEPGLQELAANLSNVSIYTADLADEADTRRVLDRFRIEHPRVDTLIHNAGFLKPQLFADMPDERWRLTFNVGIQAAWLLTKAFWADWLFTGGAAIYVSSRSGIEGFAGEAPYCATKHAIEGFVKALAIEGEASGIMLHAVTPGMYIHTAMSEQNYTAELKQQWADPAEFAPAFLYLAERRDPSLSRRRLDAWAISQELRKSASG
jgi:3-hydroxybutyrate dehydrogenase